LESEYTVYLDVVFIINFFMDYVLLWGTAKFSQMRTNWIRLASGALVGAFYSLALLMPSLHFMLAISIKIFFSVIMVLVSFPYLNFKRFIHILGYFYLVAFTMGGAVLGALYLLSEETDIYQIVNGIFIFISNIRFTWLLVAVAAAIVLVKYGVGFVKRNFLNSFFSVPVIVRFGDKKVSARALIDTGNQLKDPLTQKPVMIMEYDLVKNILPSGVSKAFSEGNDVNLEGIVASMGDTHWASRVRIIPFTSIGKYRGMLIGLRPDEVVVITNDGLVRLKDIIVGIYHKRLSPEGAYRALLHPDILHSTMGL